MCKERGSSIALLRRGFKKGFWASVFLPLHPPHTHTPPLPPLQAEHQANAGGEAVNEKIQKSTEYGQ